MAEHLEAWSKNTDRPLTPKWVYWWDGIYRPYQGLIQNAVRAYPIELDDQIHHPRSSQAFAFNLFLPFLQEPFLLSDCISELVGNELTIDRVYFEWAPPPELLVEPLHYVTAVDVALWGRLNGGGRAAVLLEVKLTEQSFSLCNGRISRSNDRRDVCQSARTFLGDPGACYLIRSAGAERTGRFRRYWEIFSRGSGSISDAFPNVDPEGECPFALDMNQPMRNLAIARGLEQEGIVEKAWFALCAHDDNPDISGIWTAWQDILPDEDPARAPFLPASEVVRLGEANGLKDWATCMRERYLINGGTG